MHALFQCVGMSAFGLLVLISQQGEHIRLCSSKAVKSDAVGSVVAKTILFVTVFGNEGEICYGFAYVFSKLVNTAGMRN